eukprot:4547291-Pyramimonas_sp.AAC.1
MPAACGITSKVIYTYTRDHADAPSSRVVVFAWRSQEVQVVGCSKRVRANLIYSVCSKSLVNVVTVDFWEP